MIALLLTVGCVEMRGEAAPAERVIQGAELEVWFNASLQSSAPHQERVDLGGGLEAELALDASTKGNGLLTLLNLRLRVVDQHDDGLLFPEPLGLGLIDLDRDGYLDVVATGPALLTGEDEREPSRPASVTAIFMLDPKARRYAPRLLVTPDEARPLLLLSAD